MPELTRARSQREAAVWFSGFSSVSRGCLPWVTLVVSHHEAPLASADLNCRRTIGTIPVSVDQGAAIALSHFFGIYESERNRARELQSPKWQPRDGDCVRRYHSLESGTGTTASKRSTSKVRTLDYLSGNVKMWRSYCGAACSPYERRSVADHI